MSGGRVSVVDKKPHYENQEYDRTLVSTQVKYNSDTYVDVNKVKDRLSSSSSEDSNTQVVQYKEAGTSSWFWWLLLLLLLLLLALLTALCCLLNTCCPYFGYCYRRNRKVRSAEQQTKVSHFTRNRSSSGRKSVGVQVFEPQTLYPTDHQAEANMYYVHPESNVRNRDRVVFLSRQSPVRSFHSFGRSNRNYDAMLVEDVGDSKEYRVLDPSRLPQSKPRSHQDEYKPRSNQDGYDEEQHINARQTVFVKEGNAEIMRLVTQAHKNDSQDHGKNLIMQRFIEDQNRHHLHPDEWRRFEDSTNKETVRMDQDRLVKHEIGQGQIHTEASHHQGNHNVGEMGQHEHQIAGGTNFRDNQHEFNHDIQISGGEVYYNNQLRLAVPGGSGFQGNHQTETNHHQGNQTNVVGQHQMSPVHHDSHHPDKEPGVHFQSTQMETLHPHSEDERGFQNHSKQDKEFQIHPEQEREFQTHPEQERGFQPHYQQERGFQTHSQEEREFQTHSQEERGFHQEERRDDDILRRLMELNRSGDDSRGGLTMLQRDLLVTRFLVEEQRKLLLNQAGDTQSLPGGTCAATQTDATKGTQTDDTQLNSLRPPKRQVKSDNDSDSDSEVYHRKKYRIRRYQIKTPILEETENGSEYSLRNRSSHRYPMKIKYVSPSMSSLYFYTQTDDSSSSSNKNTIYRTNSHPILRDIESDGTFPYIPPCIKSRLLARRRSQQHDYQSEPVPSKRQETKPKQPVQPRYMEWYKKKKEERERMKKMTEEEERLKQMGRTRKITKKEKTETVHYERNGNTLSDKVVRTKNETIRFEDDRDAQQSDSVMKLKKNQQLVEKKSVFTIAYDDVATERLKSVDTPLT
uniref:Cadherin-86C n=1 Tax=Cacopsylla melanoneura TaxID=428564 RepID=A0A8D8YT93_9HEMI